MAKMLLKTIGLIALLGTFTKICNFYYSRVI